METSDYLIIGGGIAGTNAAETIRSKDANSTIALITEEPDRLYSRVLLPHYLRNENNFEALFLRKPDDYEKGKINFLPNQRVIKLDIAAKTVTTDKGNTYLFKKLLLASGGKVNKLDLPGSNLDQVVYLRTLANVKKVKEIMNSSHEALVLGGGFIGIEFAQSFVKNGLKTTAIIREKTFWEKVVGENSGQLLSQILTENGVTIIPSTTVTEFVGTEKLEAVKLSAGQTVKADIVGVGVGIHLDLDYLKDTELAIQKGVVTNEFLETSVPHIWVAGDLAEFYDPILKKYHSLGNWTNASAQGRIVGLNMVGEKTAFATSSVYSITIFGHNFSFLGDPTGDEKTEIIERGSVQEKKLGRLLIKDNRIIGASLINLPIDRVAVDKLIRNQTDIAQVKDKLSDLSFNLGEVL